MTNPSAPRIGRRRRNVVLAAIVAVAIAVAAVGCGGGSADASDIAERQVRVAATTNFITDVARQVGGDRVEVTGLMGPGVDPHVYKASAGDMSALRDADVIFYGGLELEGRMTDLLVEMAGRTNTVAVTRDMPEDELRQPSEFEGKYDPHVWFDVPLWKNAVTTVAEAYAATDPDHADGYRERADAYLAELDALDARVRERFAQIPERSRVLITSHDAFGYLGDEYGLEVVGIQGTSTATEATTADIDRVATIVADRQVKAVFGESAVSGQTLQAVLAAARRKGQTAVIGGELFADAAGGEGTPEGTYLGRVEHNARPISDALR